MSVYTESGFRFDFTAAVDSVVHDKTDPGDGNTIWPGVDFRIFESERQVWIEVKSWSRHLIVDSTERRRSGRDYQRKMDSAQFRDEIVEKFLGTTSYLYWSEKRLPERVTYIVFLEPPNRDARAMLGPFQDRLRDEFKKTQSRSWGKRIEYRVVDMAGFRDALPDYRITNVR